MKLRCNHIVVTGGGGGIGSAIAARLIEGGATVVIAGLNMEKLCAVQEKIASDRLYCMEWDVTDTEHARENLLKAADLMGGFDGLVNNAGLGGNQAMGRGYEPWDITPAEWDRMTAVNLKAVFFNMRDAVDLMRENGTRGNILNIASNAACMDIIGSYSASKLDVLKMTSSFGRRFGRDGIIINGIAPGATFTPMISDYAKAVDQPYPRHAIGRFIRPEEIAELAHYLMSDYGEIICGHTVVADGGDTARRD